MNIIINRMDMDVFVSMIIKRFVLVLINNYRKLINLVVSFFSSIEILYPFQILRGICKRPGICGPESAKCSETSDSFQHTADGPYFACFCSSNSVVIGNKCPDDVPISSTTLNPLTSSGEMSSISSTSTTKKSSSSSTCPKCDTRSNSSHLFIQPIFILFFNLLHFLNK